MATRIEILDTIISRLSEDIPDLDVQDFPVNTTEFQVQHPNGHILVSHSGADAIRSQESTPVGIKFSPFVVMEYRWELTLIVAAFQSTRGVLEYVSRILDSMKKILIDDNFRMYYLSDTQPTYDDENKFTFIQISFVCYIPQIEEFDN